MLLPEFWLFSGDCPSGLAVGDLSIALSDKRVDFAKEILLCVPGRTMLGKLPDCGRKLRVGLWATTRKMSAQVVRELHCARIKLLNARHTRTSLAHKPSGKHFGDLLVGGRWRKSERCRDTLDKRRLPSHF
jgi:hypothetical protein